MTPTEIETRARSKYNAVGDSFFSQAELLDFLYQGCMELSTVALVIEGQPQTTSTVASQQEYAAPTNCISIKRITYNGKKLKKIDFRDDDALTGLDASTTATGTPQYYFEWNETIYLRPIPDSVGTLKIFTYSEPSAITSSSTIEVPTRYHMGLVDFIVKEMCAKDSNFEAARFYDEKWERFLERSVAWERKKKRADGFSAVKDEDTMVEGFLGTV